MGVSDGLLRDDPRAPAVHRNPDRRHTLPCLRGLGRSVAALRRPRGALDGAPVLPVRGLPVAASPRRRPQPVARRADAPADHAGGDTWPKPEPAPARALARPAAAAVWLSCPVPLMTPPSADLRTSPFLLAARQPPGGQKKHQTGTQRARCSGPALDLLHGTKSHRMTPSVPRAGPRSVVRVLVHRAPARGYKRGTKQIPACPQRPTTKAQQTYNERARGEAYGSGGGCRPRNACTAHVSHARPASSSLR